MKHTSNTCAVSRSLGVGGMMSNTNTASNNVAAEAASDTAAASMASLEVAAEAPATAVLVPPQHAAAASTTPTSTALQPPAPDAGATAATDTAGGSGGDSSLPAGDSSKGDQTSAPSSVHTMRAAGRAAVPPQARPQVDAGAGAAVASLSPQSGDVDGTPRSTQSTPHGNVGRHSSRYGSQPRVCSIVTLPHAYGTHTT